MNNPFQIVPANEIQINQGEGNEQENLEREQQINEILVLLTKSKRSIICRLVGAFGEFILMLTAFILLPDECLESDMKQFFSLVVSIEILSFLNRLYLFAIVYRNHKEVERLRVSHTLPYPLYAYLNEQTYYSAIQDYYFGYRYFRYFYVLYEIILFFLNQSIFYDSFDSKCELGKKKTNFTWAAAFIYLIIRYISIGLPAIIGIIYLLLAPFLYCFMNGQHQQEQGLPEDKIKDLEIKKVDEQFNNEISCIICLQEFQVDEEYIQLKCHQTHIYHKQCIIDWVKRKSHCPKCRQAI